MICAAYIRVSSKAQDLAMQRGAIERQAAARGDTIGEWFAEKASAKTIARPELQRLRAEVRAGRVQRLYVFRLDRLARTGIKDTFELVEELRAHGCDLVTCADGFQLSGPAAEIILAVMAWAAQMERLAINERISAARVRMEGEGRAWGRPSTVDRETERAILRLQGEGRSVRSIAMSSGVKRSTVQRILSRNPPPQDAPQAP